MLTTLKRSPKEFQERYITQNWVEKDQKAFRIGNMVHCLSLEPSEFDQRYIAGEKHDRRTNAGKAAWSDFLERAGDREVVDPEEAELAMVCNKELDAASRIWPFLRSPDGFSGRRRADQLHASWGRLSLQAGHADS